jgi:hypothetical protein
LIIPEDGVVGGKASAENGQCSLSIGTYIEWPGNSGRARFETINFNNGSAFGGFAWLRTATTARHGADYAYANR